MRLSIRRLLSWSLCSGALLVVTRMAGVSTPGAMFVRTLLELLLFFVLIWLPGQVLLWEIRPDALDDNDLFLLSIPTSLVLYSVVGIPLFWMSAPAWVFKLLFLPAVGYAGVLFVRRLWRERELVLPACLPFTYLIAACAVCFVCVGQASPWKNMVWTDPANRGLHSMPIDNALPFFTAEVFIKGTKPWLLWPWTMGDRPAFSGLITAVFAKAFLFRTIKYFDFTILGILLNSIYAIPLIEYAQKFRASRRMATFVTASLMWTPYLFLNSFFTWPKTFGVFFTLIVLALFTRRASDSLWCIPSPRASLLAGTLLGLAMLCHGGSLLSIPLVLVLIAWFSGGRSTLSQLLKGGLLSAVAVFLLQMPWKIYKLRHPEVDTNLLLYHYIPFALPAAPPPLLEWLKATGWDVQLTQRFEQVRQTLLGGQFGDELRALYTGEVVAHDAGRWAFEMWRAPAQVGEWRILLGVGSMAGLAALARRKMPFRTRTPDLWMSIIAITTALANYVMNVFLKWKEIDPHGLPLIEIFLVAVPLTVAIFSFSRVLSALLLFLVVRRFLSYLVACTFAKGLPMDLFAFGVFASVFGVLWLCLSTPESEREPSVLADVDA